CAEDGDRLLALVIGDAGDDFDDERGQHRAVLAAAEADQLGAGVVQIQVAEGVFDVAVAASLKAIWISLADRKRGFEGVLWYQGMSRVCPGCPQTSPREAREESCIRKAYGEHPGANTECGMRNRRSKPPKATSKPPDSQYPGHSSARGGSTVA